MRVLILGGDGFVGWPVTLRLSAAGHDVWIVDDLSRRRIDQELGCTSLTPIASPEERIAAWRERTGREIHFELLNVARDYEGLCALLRSVRPETVVHFAEQRAAPYSMKSPQHKRYTVSNNVSSTHNLLCALVETALDAHVVHMGTMGVYGYGTAGTSIPEGYLTVQVRTDDGATIEREILYPTSPGSVYHMTKCLDQQLFAFYAKNDRLRITDLHQGIVWGTRTDETAIDERLVNRFDYDGDYGTVLNRFLIQAALGYPLTVHGTGGQTRAFIHIRDSARCVQLAVENPPASGEPVRIFNQLTETHRVRDLAALVSRLTGTPVDHVPNPRLEAPENELSARNDHLIKLGLSPTRLEVGLLEEILHVAERFRDRVDRTRIPARSAWNRERARALESASPGSPTEGVNQG